MESLLTEPWLPLCIVAFLAGFTQGLTGFGSVLVSLPLLSIFLPIKTVIPLVAMFGMGVNIWLCLSLRNHLRWKPLALLLAATLPGLPLGVWALASMPTWILTLLVGAMLVPFSLQALLLNPRPRNLGRGWALVAGFLAGFLGGATGANGPPIIVYASVQPWHRHETKVLMTSYFLTSGVFIIASYAMTGMIDSRVLLLLAAALPALVLGLGLGMLVYGRLGDRGYRKLVHVLVLFLGAFMVVRGLMAAWA